MKLSAIYSFSKTVSSRSQLASAVAVATVAAAVSFPAMAASSDNEAAILSAARVFQQAKSIIDVNQLAGNASVIQQVGDNNSGSVSQSRAAGYQMGNLAYIYQNGRNNNASIDQQGGNNIGVVSQVGDDHSATISQTGNSLSLRADVSQVGFKSDVSLSQSGSGSRSISVEQQNYSGNARPVTIDAY
ncbi:hypothetical protein [Vreelandella subglaciescola]|jgi:minor curlin subunit|uniref:Minor curlin subunit n=1 Tax=Vreelandella subglaciescola TaxID=29571 RepID=A0A1M7H8L6_9GAMM|nr:hypothetical protein [Halomonas subglaciescola]SHM24884.1 minor curlin subunit [Halomonas subglaciescola]